MAKQAILIHHKTKEIIGRWMFGRIPVVGEFIVATDVKNFKETTTGNWMVARVIHNATKKFNTDGKEIKNVENDCTTQLIVQEAEI